MAYEERQKNILANNEIGSIGGSVHQGDIYNYYHASDKRLAILPKFLTAIPNVGEFVGRKAELEKIDALLQANKPVLVVNGLGGVGKTTLALAYAHQHAEQYTHIAWIRQTSTLMEALAYNPLLLTYLNIELQQHIPLKEKAELVCKRLEALKGTHLLIVDNYNHTKEDAEARFLQNAFFGAWRVLFTSREIIPQFARIDIDVLSKQDGIALFRLHIGEKQASDEEITALLEYIGFHTLTTELLAKTYRKSLRLQSVKEMTDLLQKQEIDANVLQKDVYTAHKGTNTKVYEHLLRAFAITDLDEQEIFILKQFAVLPSMSFSGKDFLLWIKDKEGVYEDTLLTLYKKGWLTCKEGDMFSMHLLAQMLMRKQLKPCLSDCKNLVDSFIDLMDFDVVTAQPLEHRWLIDAGEALVRNIDFQDNLDKKALLWNRLYYVYDGLGEYNNALICMKESLFLYEKSVGKQSPKYLTALNNLGSSYYSIGNYTEALVLLQEFLALTKDMLGTQHPSYLTALNNVALLHKAMGNYTEALPLLQESLQQRKKIFGEKHYDYITSLNNLATLYDAMGNYNESLPLYQECLQLQKEILGERHPDYLISLNNIGTWYFRQKRYTDALPYFQDAYYNFENVLGVEHPHTKNTKKWLDITNKLLGN